MKWISKIFFVLLTVTVIIESVGCEILAKQKIFKGEHTTHNVQTEEKSKIILSRQNHERFNQNDTTKIITTFQTTTTNSSGSQSVRVQVNEKATKELQDRKRRTKRRKQLQIVRDTTTTSRTSVAEPTSKSISKPKHQNYNQGELWSQYLLLWS